MWVSAALGVLALLPLALLYAALRSTSRLGQAQQLDANAQRIENERNQTAILQLLDEISGLADGDLTVTATVTEHMTGAIADSVNVAVESTRGLIGRSALARMKPGASLINFGRGAVLDDAALLERLDIGALDHAVLDVFAVEPLPSHARFWTHQRVTVLPHISAPTNVATASAIVAGNLELYFRERRIPETVDRRRGY